MTKKNIIGLPNIKNLFRKGSFIQNISVVFTGNAFNFILQLIFTPVISRLFSPEAYGEYAYYNLIISNIIFVSSLSLPTVYILPKKAKEFLLLGKIVLTASILISILATIFYYLFRNILELTFIPHWQVFLLILIIVFSNIVSLLATWNMRGKRFKRSTTVNSSVQLISRLSVLSIGKLGVLSGLGLLAGDITKIVGQFLFQTKRIETKLILYFIIKSDWSKTLEVFKKHLNVVKFIFPSQLLSKITASLPILIIGSFYNKEMLGYYTFAISLLNIPQNLVSKAIQPVFFQKANEVFQRDPNEVGSFLEKTILICMGLTFIPLSIILIWSKELFLFVFGNEWEISGKITSIVGFQYILNTIASSFNGIRRILKLEKRILYLTIIGVIVKVAPLSLIWTEVGFFDFIFYLAIFNSAFIIFNFVDLFRSILTLKKVFRLTFIIVVAVALAVLIALYSL